MSNPIRHLPDIRRRGTAMSEMVLVLPLLLVVFMLALYFGRGMVRVQHTRVIDRYEAWRAPVPASRRLFDGDPASPYDTFGPHPHSPPDATHRMLNQAFLDELASQLSVDSDRLYGGWAVQRWIDAAADRSEDAGDLADEMAQQLGVGWRVKVSSEYDETVRMYERFNGPNQSSHALRADDWRFDHRWRDVTGQSAQDFRHHSYLARWVPDDSSWAPNWQSWPSHGVPDTNWGAVWFVEGSTSIASLRPTVLTFFDQFTDQLEAVRQYDEEGFSETPNALAEHLQGLFLARPGYYGPAVRFR